MGELPTTSQGVDLFELERLRVLVRFEFDRELTQDELIMALTRCHNNTREAYHFLKEQRRQEQLNAAAEMVAAAAATAHGSSVSAQAAAHGHDVNGHNSGPNTSNGNGAKRRSDSDGDVSMDTSNKRHRVSTDAVTIDLSQPSEILDMTQATQEQDDSDNPGMTPTHKRPRHYSLERASQIISDVVGTIMQSAHASRDDAQWLFASLEALAVKRVPHLDDPLVVVVEALANALKHVPTMDVAAVQSDGIKQIMDVLVQLPRQDQYDVELRLEPSTAKMNEDVHKVDNSFACAIADHMNKSARAQAAKNAISVIKDALESCIVRQESISKSVQSAQAHRRRVRTRVRDLKNSIQARLEQAGKDVKTSEQEMIQARNSQMTHTAALMAAVVEHKAALLAQGEEEADATLNAHAAVVHSTDAGVVRLRQVREESQLIHKARKQDVMRANTRLEFYQKLEVLRQKVAPCVQDWLEASTRQVELLKADAERFVEEKLTTYVSQMVQSLRLYYEFHTLRQMLANKDKEKQKESLNEHMEFYDDLVPSSKKEIENKIREFTGVIMHSTQCMREIVSLQCELWEGKRKLFPPHVFAIVESEYGKLWNQLSGGAKDMMLDVVKVIRDQPAAAQPVASPRDFSPPNVGHSATVTPYEFVGRDIDSHRPQPVRVFLAPPVSPVVDLTGDGDGDVSMDGINMDGFVRERFVVYQPNNQASNEPMSEDGLGSAAELPAFKMEKNASEPAAPAPAKAREFPMGSHLCWMLKDEDGDTNVHFGYVKGLAPSGSYILEDSEGLEHTIPAASLFTYEEREAYLREQGQNTENEDGGKENGSEGFTPDMANAKRWNIVETRVIETHKTADGGKCVNNYALLRTLGQGRFAKVKLVERIPPPPTPPAPATPASSTSSDADTPLPAMPPVMAPLRPTFAQPPPAAAPRRQFAMKIFSKAMLSKMKDYVSQGAPRQQSDTGSPPLSPSLPPPQPQSQFPSSSMRVVTALDRMRDEVRIMRTLYHRNIVLLFEVIESETSDKIYLVLEYMPQGPCMVFRPDTKDFVSPITKSVLTDDLARAHTLDILHGLEYLHARGICHRDLKPDNVLLNATGRCHISDFGCALMQPSATAPLHVADTVGTYQFLSPESCSGELYDPFQTDIWAVGVILFVFLFGTLPFQGETTRELFDAIAQCDLVVPDDKRPISSECRDLLVRLLSKEASQRISIADALRHPWLCAKGDDEDEPPSF